MNLVSRCTERIPDVLASTASESPGKTRHESQLPLSSWNEQHQRTGRLVLDAYSSNYSEWNADKNWSSQEWKSDELIEVRTGRPVYEQPPGLFTEHTDKCIVDDDDMDSDTVAESDMLWESRSFLHRVNDRVRKIQNQSSKDATQDSKRHSFLLGIFLSSTLEASVFIGKNYSENLRSIKNSGKDITMKQMFDISEKLVTEQSDEIYGVNTIQWSDSAWKHLTLIGGEEVVSLSRAKAHVFSDSVLCLGKMSENPLSNCAWEDKLTWFKSSSAYKTLNTLNDEPMEFEWNIFPGFTTLQLCYKVQEFMSKMSVQPEDFTGRIIFMSMFNDIFWKSKENKQECESRAQLNSIFSKRIFTRKMVIPRTWIRKEVIFYSWKQTTKRMGQSRWINDDQIRRKRTPSLPIHESIIPRSAQKRRWWKIVDTLLRRPGNDWNCFLHDYFCSSVQYLRSSIRFMWRMQILPCEKRETCFGETIWPIVSAFKYDENTYTFDW